MKLSTFSLSLCISLFILLSCTKQSATDNENQFTKTIYDNKITQNLSEKLDQLQTELGKPQRVEVRHFITNQRSIYKQDLAEIKKIKAQLDKKSDFYFEISLFTDESNDKGPLVARISVLKTKDNNLIKELTYNLN